MAKVTFTLTDKLFKEIKHYCIENDFTLTELIRACLEQELDGVKPVINKSNGSPTVSKATPSKAPQVDKNNDMEFSL